LYRRINSAVGGCPWSIFNGVLPGSFETLLSLMARFRLLTGADLDGALYLLEVNADGAAAARCVVVR